MNDTLRAAAIEEDVTIAVLSNSEAAPAMRLADELADIMFGIERTVVDLDVPEEWLAAIAGKYDLEMAGLRTDVRVRGGHVFIQLQGQPEFRGMFQGGGVFLAEFDEKVRFTFDPPVDGIIHGFRVDQAGMRIRAERVED